MTLEAKFTNHYRNDARNRTRICSPGNQYLLQLFKGGYLDRDLTEGRGRSALDVGCGNGFELVSLHMMGWTTFGVEITEEIAETARSNTTDYGADAEIRVGGNSQIPFEDCQFDLLLSMNALHYADSDDLVRQSLVEYKRVMAPNARTLILTQHPDHYLLDDAKQRSQNVYEITRTDDYRRGELVYRFTSAQELEDAMSEQFDEVQVGINRTTLFSREIATYVATGTKRDDR